MIHEVKHRGPALALATAVTACSTASPPVPLVGTAGDIEALVGEWVGEYSSVESGRGGRVTFTLAAEGDTARGDVIMIPRGANQPLRPEPGDPGAVGARPVSEVLTIKFVRITGDRVSGSLAPYRDPACGCTLQTTFEGSLSGDAIEGTYLTRHGQTNELVRGRWKVTRSPPR